MYLWDKSQYPELRLACKPHTPYFPILGSLRSKFLPISQKVCQFSLIQFVNLQINMYINFTLLSNANLFWRLLYCGINITLSTVQCVP